MKWYMKIIYPIIWIIVGLFRAVGIGMGFVFVPLGLALSEEGEWPKLLWPWYNDEDDPRIARMNWWHIDQQSEGWFRRTFPNFNWLARRNPFNNMRYMFKERKAHTYGNWGEEFITPKMVRDKGMKMAYRWVWSGWLSSYRRITIISQTEYTDLWIGFKLNHPTPGVGFTFRVPFITRSF